MGRAGGGSVHMDVCMRICIYMRKGDATPCQGPPAYWVRDGQGDGQVSAEMGGGGAG